MLDRTLQKHILQTLASNYPGNMSCDELAAALEPPGEFTQQMNANLYYLEQHGLVEVQWVNALGSAQPIAVAAGIHARGLDFLADDGGLSAILGVVTIKLHEETLRQLIEARIQTSDLSPADKRKWTHALQELPAESIKHLTTKLIDLALDKAPGALPLIAKFLSLG